jgi:hypothetical protein
MTSVRVLKHNNRVCVLLTTASRGLLPLRLLKPPSNFLEKKARRNLATGILCLVVFLVLFFTSIDFIPSYVDLGRYNTVRGTALGLLLAAFYYFFLFQCRIWRAGIIGEQRVANTLLSSLSDEYSLFNNVKLKGMGDGDIDHIVIGPTGIFAMETKNWRGRISFWGDDWLRHRGSPSKRLELMP